MLATYNMAQISKLESMIEAKQCKTDLLTDISKLHEQHLNKLDTMVDNTGEKLQVIIVNQAFRTSVDHILAQIYLDEQKLRSVVATFKWLIHTAFDQKLAPGVLSYDVLIIIVDHIKDVANSNGFHNFIHQPADLYKLETSIIHCVEEEMVVIILHVPLVEAANLLPLYKFIPLPIHFNFSANISVIPDVGQADLITIGHTEAFQTHSSDLANCRCLGSTFFCDGPSVLQTNIIQDCLGSLFMASSKLIKDNCKFKILDTREKSSALLTTHGLCTQ